MNELTQAQNPSTPTARLDELSVSKEPQVRSWVAKNPNTSSRSLLSLLKQFPDEVMTNPSFELYLLENPELLQKIEAEAAFILATREKISDAILGLLVSHSEETRRLISYRKDLSLPLLKRLAEHTSMTNVVLNHPNCNEDVWEILANGSSTQKLFIARTKGLPNAIKERLAVEGDPQIHQALRLREEEPLCKALPRIEIRGGTDVGSERNYNEDDFGISHGETLALAVIADGMGGQSTGHAASEPIKKLFMERASLADKTKLNAQEFLHQAVIDSYDAIADVVKSGGYSKVCFQEKVLRIYVGAAAVALLLQGDTATIAHVGDCRAYLLREGALSQLTEDHSLLNDYIKRGHSLTPEEIENFPHKNIITRAIGMNANVSPPDITRLIVQPKDLLLLCSDGLTSMVNDEAIRQELLAEKTLDEKIKSLIAQANNAGGKDNITVILVEVYGGLYEATYDPGIYSGRGRETI